MRGLDRLALVAALLASSGCGGSPATPGPIATSSSTVITSTPRPTAVERSDAEKEALVRENIDLVYCGGQPKPEWCGFMKLAAKKPDVTIDGTSLSVVAKASTPKTVAQNMCKAFAGASYDDNALPIGFLHVFVEAAGKVIADCDVR